MTNLPPESEQKRDPARITHYMLPNRSLIPIDGYLIPERTWVVIRDALQRGTWGDWEEWVNEEVTHPDVPSITELRSTLWRAGLKEQAIRDLVLLAVVVRDRVHREVHDNLSMDAIPTGFEPLNIQPVDSLLDVVDRDDVDDFEVELEFDEGDSGDISFSSDFFTEIPDDDDEEQDDERGPHLPPSRFGGSRFGGSESRFSGLSRFSSGFPAGDGNESPSRFGAFGNRFSSSSKQPPEGPTGYLSARLRQLREQSSGDDETSDAQPRETQQRLEIMGVEQTNIKQLLLILVAMNLVMFAALAALTARLF